MKYKVEVIAEPITIKCPKCRQHLKLIVDTQAKRICRTCGVLLEITKEV